MPGSVYVFNCFNEPSVVSVQGLEAAQVGPWGQEGAGPYVPHAAPVPRVREPQPEVAAFADGDNEVAVAWTSGTATTTVSIPCPSQGVSLEDDLVLLLLETSALLLTTRGYELGRAEVVWPPCDEPEPRT